MKILDLKKIKKVSEEIGEKTLITNKYIGKKLKFNLIILIAMFSIMAVLIIIDIFKFNTDFWIVFAGFAVGPFVGLIFQRSFKFNWQQEKGYQKLVSKLDRDGIIVMILYGIFMVTRKWVFSHWLHGHTLITLVFALSSGAMMGRLIYIFSKVKEILKQEV